MVSIDSFVFSWTVVIFFDIGQSLVKLAVDNKDTPTTEVIHNTIYNLFRTLNINKVSEKPSINEYNTLNNYFTSLTLEGNKNVNEIVRLTKVNSDKEASLVDTINDVLGEDDLETTKTETDDLDINVVGFIHNFLIDLQQLTKEFDINNVYVNVNPNVLKLLKHSNGKIMDDISKTELSLNKSDDSNVTSDNEYWEPSGRRIYKGERTKINHFPFMATIQIFNDFHCAGSIIKSDLIITASSCLQLAWNNRLFRENPAFLSVRVGSSFYNGGGEVIAVIEVYFHPGYNPKTLKNNICLLRLARQIQFRRKEKKVKKIDFDRHDSNLPYNTPGITVIGWGAKEHSPVVGNPWKNIISYAVLDVYPLRDCQDIYSREYVTMKNFCAGFLSRGGGACNRDVGGPGIVDGKLMGVISFGSPVCGTPDSPTVFTKLGYYTDWIEEIMEQDVPVSKKRTTPRPTFNYEFITQTQPQHTTFKIPPIAGKTMTPIPISQIDSLRVIDEKVFKEFLETMFDSKEIKEYEDIIKDDYDLTVNNDDKKNLDEENLDKTGSVTEPQNIEGPHTQILDVSDNENDKTSFDTAYTVLDQDNNPYADEYDKEMSKAISNEDLERIVKEEFKVSSGTVNDTKKGVSEINGRNENVNEYLSEKENNFKMFTKDKTKDKDNEGLSIPDDIFEDLTRAKENADGVLPESVLYELLSEVIKDEVENININIYCAFIFVKLKYGLGNFFIQFFASVSQGGFEEPVLFSIFINSFT